MAGRPSNPLAASLLGSLLLAAGPATAQLPSAFDISVPAPPVAAHVAGRAELVYELHLSNFASQALDPVRVEVLEGGQIITAYDGDALSQRIDRSGQQLPSGDYDAIPPGRRGIVFLEFDPGIGDGLPRVLTHRVRYRATAADGTTRKYTAEGGLTTVETDERPLLRPPLTGGPWVAIGDARLERGHRRVAYALDGKVRTPGRFALDWVKLGPDGNRLRDDGDRPDSAYSYGESVHAVADGTVVDVRDDVAERRTMSERPTPARLRSDGSGNAIVLDLGDGRFAHYAHLRPGSVRVAAGQRVRRGEAIAQVGFSGSASAPQLHFNVTDGTVENASEGLPYRFDTFELLGMSEGSAGPESWERPVSGSDSRTAEMPARGAVLRFRD